MPTTLSTSKSFIESYIEYANDLTDAPETYRQFLGLNLISLATGRTAIEITPTVLYPNLYVILIGTSGVARKSSAMKISMGILPTDYNALPNDFSPESLQEAISIQPQGLIWKEEIGGFLEAIKKKDYMSGMSDLVCQIYDSPDTYTKRLRSKEFNLQNVCINIVGGTTPSRFIDTVEPSDFNSGFLSRPLIVVGTRTKTLHRRKISAIDTHRRDTLRKQWKKIFDLFHTKQKVSFEFEDSALDYINDWCDLKEAEVLKCEDAHEADLKGSILTRMQDYCFKLSALYEVDKLTQIVGSKGSKVVGSKPSTITISIESSKRACLTIGNL